MDLGDWQELSRLRYENHLWHRCVDEILEAVGHSSMSAEVLASVVETAVATLNERLQASGRRPVARRRA